MPGNREQVERTALQFGAFGLQDPDEDDIDGDREEPETRAQPPGDSPVAHPRPSSSRAARSCPRGFPEACSYWSCRRSSWYGLPPLVPPRLPN